MQAEYANKQGWNDNVSLYKACILLATVHLSSLSSYALPVIPSVFSAGSRITNRCLIRPSSSCTYLSSIPIYFDSSNHFHKCIQYHPEQPLRISVCVEKLYEQANILNDACGFTLCDVSSLSHDSASEETSATTFHRPFTSDELDYTKLILHQVHSEEYVNLFLRKCRTSRDARLTQGKDPLGFIGYVDDGDTYVTTESYDVCLRAAATWIRSVNHVLLEQPSTTTVSSKSISSWSASTAAAVALTRPPGHHAKKALANGFCIFNFCASAVIHALQILQGRKQRHPRISVLDWDVHYGQGTADILQHYPQVRYVSIHQTPAFPYEGQTRSKSGPHRNIFTIPIVADTSWEGGYRDRFENLALPFIASPSSKCNNTTAATTDFKQEQRQEEENDSWIPDLIIISAGYDALDNDPLASISLQPEDYRKMIHSLQRHLLECCSYQDHKYKMPGIVLGLEGGYQLQKDSSGLDEAVLATVQALVETRLDSISSK